MVTVSPPVSPSVVAAILIIQKASVTSGILLNDLARLLSFVSPDPEAVCSGYHGRPRIPGIPGLSQRLTPDLCSSAKNNPTHFDDFWLGAVPEVARF